MAEKFANSRERIMACRIVRVLKQNNKMNAENLYKTSQEEMPFKITPEIFKEALLNVITDGYVLINDSDGIKIYEYVDKAESEDEFDEFESEE